MSLEAFVSLSCAALLLVYLLVALLVPERF